MKNEDVYEYQFYSLYQQVKSLIGRNTISLYDDSDPIEKEVTDYLGKSELLFDLTGIDYKLLKKADIEYRYWVEIYVLKIVENLLCRYDVNYEEKYHPNNNEKYSIIYELSGKKIESYFLFDIYYDEINRTNYDSIAQALKADCQEVDEIYIYIFRDNICKSDAAWLVNNCCEFNENGFVKTFPLKHFFELLFDSEEYEIFCNYAKSFYEKCNNVISYKTIILPTRNTIDSYKLKKQKMLMQMDYKAIAVKGKSGSLSDDEFEKVKNSFLHNKMYMAMIGENDFADSFISAEWSYDVYSNAMGELELTGIISGYLKSIEQLLYAITRFHINKGLFINTRKEGKKIYSTDIEDIIDSTLGSLNDFVTSKEAKLAIDVKIRGCLRKAISLWTQYQRNGYFHKHNLHMSDNKIDEVRELTLYLYFLILGGIYFTPEQRIRLGIRSVEDDSGKNNTVEINCFQFNEWMNDILKYELHESVSGIWLSLITIENEWSIKPYLMTSFQIDDFESGELDFINIIDMRHSKNIIPFCWKSMTSDYNDEVCKVQDLIYNYIELNEEKLDNMGAIVLEGYKQTQLVYLKK